jgi:hypothetical protein
MAAAHCKSCGLTDVEEVDSFVNLGYSTCCNEPIVTRCSLHEDGCAHDIQAVELRNSIEPMPGFHYVGGYSEHPGRRPGPGKRASSQDWSQLGALIHRRRKELGLTMGAVANLLAVELQPIGVPGSTVSQNEAGRRWRNHPYLPKAYATVLTIPRREVRRLVPGSARPAIDQAGFDEPPDLSPDSSPGRMNRA